MYAQGHMSRPLDGCGPLTAFDSRVAATAAARWWASLGRAVEAWEADAEPYEETLIWDRHSHTHVPAFFDTVLCSSITLLRRVWPAEKT